MYLFDLGGFGSLVALFGFVLIMLKFSKLKKEEQKAITKFNEAKALQEEGIVLKGIEITIKDIPNKEFK
ncbi:hypothetical protein BKH46_09275 [Helicobacter sp. 12S02634-8]|uniref:hypothetical protein n=1 Tax=Helicobacter sp. 12S02634-8 TaxID=1476199 RepID=UPI000BA62A52|nr:hypothetical protein [Helicobacter sp. 12S02634-8]PAF45544.1 hypothetical protein BKH46_09275 [Helicobacter sp. 12S02634-8]